MKIVVVGAGYVGLSLAVLLSQTNEVIISDILANKVELINQHLSPIQDKEIDFYLSNKELNIKAVIDPSQYYLMADIVIVATPTNYDENINEFDTSSVTSVLREITAVNSNCLIVIKSTIPVGYTKSMVRELNNHNIVFSPEFLRESKALFDNLYPSRIIVGIDNDAIVEKAMIFAKELKNNSLKENVEIMLMSSQEAESVKLFSNSYLALRVAYFNELDTYASSKGLDSKNIIKGVCLDPRIGDYYNNPSFGYGGYCLPKDTKQLRSNFKDIPQDLITAVCDSNTTRKKFIKQDIIDFDNNHNFCDKTCIGIYKLAMKSNSDNFRSAAIQDIIEFLVSDGLKVIIYEPSLSCSSFKNCLVINDIQVFKNLSTTIVANRFDNDLIDVRDKVYTRDLFFRD